MRTPSLPAIRRLLSALILSALFVLAVAPASAAAGPTGSASAESAIFAITLGADRTAIGIDRVTAAVGSSRTAQAAVGILTSGTTTVGGGSRTATSKDDSGSVALGTGPQSLLGLAGVNVTEGSLDTSVTDTEVLSGAAINLADLDLAGGLASAGTARTATTSIVSNTGSVVARTLSIGALEVLSVRALLEHLGFRPTDLACTGIEAAGAELGVDTGLACETLAQAMGAIADANAVLETAQDTLEADLQTVEATVAGLTIVLQPLADLAAGYGVDLSGLLGLLLPSGQRDSLLTEINRRLDAVGDGLSGIAAGTCSAAAAAIAGVEAAVPSMSATLAPLAATAAGACDALQVILDALLDVAVVRLDGLYVSLVAHAHPETSFADGAGSIGVVSVGNRTITAAGVTAAGQTLAPTVATLRQEAGDALSALGIGAFPDPEITLLGVTKSAGPRGDGTFAAEASVTGVRIRVPSVPIGLPSGTAVGAVLARPRAFGPAAGTATRAAPLAATPTLVVEAAVFTGDALYAPAGQITPVPQDDGGTQGGALPNTGVPSAGLIVAGALAMGAAVGLRRVVVTAR